MAGLNANSQYSTKHRSRLSKRLLRAVIIFFLVLFAIQNIGAQVPAPPTTTPTSTPTSTKPQTTPSTTAPTQPPPTSPSTSKPPETSTSTTVAPKPSSSTTDSTKSSGTSSTPDKNNPTPTNGNEGKGDNQTKTPSEGSSSSGLSQGAIISIGAVGCVLILSCFVFLALRMCRGNRKRHYGSPVRGHPSVPAAHRPAPAFITSQQSRPTFVPFAPPSAAAAPSYVGTNVVMVAPSNAYVSEPVPIGRQTSDIGSSSGVHTVDYSQGAQPRPFSSEDGSASNVNLPGTTKQIHMPPH